MKRQNLAYAKNLRLGKGMIKLESTIFPGSLTQIFFSTLTRFCLREGEPKNACLESGILFCNGGWP